MSALRRLVIAGIVTCVLPTTQAAAPKLPADGWASWEVAAIENAPAWCCFRSFNAGDRAPVACPLDDGNQFSTGNRDGETTDRIRVYAHVKGGQVERVRALAAHCPVEARTPVVNVADVTADDSARWLEELGRTQAVSKGRQGIEDDSLAALTLHDGRVAGDAMARLAREGTPRVRAKAVFWLAHAGMPGAEQVLDDAARQDSDDHVREQAIFALSRLPEDRAVPALIALAKDRSLKEEHRKRAVFWLAQSGSDAAQAWLDGLLTQRAR